MDDLLIRLALLFVVCGYSALVFFVAISDFKFENWWDPFVFGACIPFLLIYEYWTGIAAVVIFFAVSIGAPVLCVKLYFWLSGVFL